MPSPSERKERSMEKLLLEYYDHVEFIFGFGLSGVLPQSARASLTQSLLERNVSSK
jgi:hypothetical protein